jgi:TonB family protein
MTTALANSDEVSLKRFIVYSLFLHGGLLATIAASIFFHLQGNPWGSQGSSSQGEANVTLVSSGKVGLPMPTPPPVDDSKVFDPTNSLYKEVPQPPKPPEAAKDVVKIPKLDREKPKPIQHPSKTFDNKTPPPDNTIAQHGGQPKLPTGYAETPGAASPGINVTGPPGGDFAGRYPAYVEAIRRRISQNWMQSTIDPAARASRSIHATATFTVYRDGSVKDIRIVESSRNSSFDNSGLRALYDSNPMPPLPADYSGSYVSVTFDFLPPGTGPR